MLPKNRIGATTLVEAEIPTVTAEAPRRAGRTLQMARQAGMGSLAPPAAQPEIVAYDPGPGRRRLERLEPATVVRQREEVPEESVPPFISALLDEVLGRTPSVPSMEVQSLEAIQSKEITELELEPVPSFPHLDRTLPLPGSQPS